MQFDRLKRREFIILLGGAVVTPRTPPLASRAQQPGKIARIGFLGIGSAFGPRRL